MAECKNCQKHKKLYEFERDQAKRDRVWAGKATEYAFAAMKSNVDVLKASLNKQEES